jgi:hypothetical protein
MTLFSNTCEYDKITALFSNTCRSNEINFHFFKHLPTEDRDLAMIHGGQAGSLNIAARLFLNAEPRPFDFPPDVGYKVHVMKIAFMI